MPRAFQQLPDLDIDSRTLEPLAELMICGDNRPWYRRGFELPEFFRAAGLTCPDHDGSTRTWWTLDRLNEYAEQPGAMEAIILRLANPREYRAAASMTEPTALPRSAPARRLAAAAHRVLSRR